MKKIFVLFVAFFFVAAAASNAKSQVFKDFYAYKVDGSKADEVTQKVLSLAKQKYVNIQSVENVRYTYYYYNKYNEAFYVRFYTANDNTNIFVVANTDYDKKYNGVADALRALNLPFEELKDKPAIKEYKDDFYNLARKNSMKGFYISPDGFKPLKSGMKKLNDRMAKNAKKTSAIPYSEDKDPIDLTCVDTQSFADSKAQISIIRKEYRMKNKQNKYVHAFEYNVSNNSNSEAVMKKVTSERLAGIKDIATETFIDLDRLDLLDTVGSFPPVLLVTAGTSILCSVPNWVRMAKVTKESVRYAHMLPENYKIEPKASMRILVMKYKNDPKPLNFELERAGATYKFSF